MVSHFGKKFAFPRLTLAIGLSVLMLLLVIGANLPVIAQDDSDYVDCDVEPDAEECSDDYEYDDDYVDCDAEPDAEECSDDYEYDDEYVDCDAEPDAEECSDDYEYDDEYVDCDAEPDAEECSDDYDYEYVDCTVEEDAPECDWADSWDGESDLPAWFSEDAIVIDCGVEDAEECDWDEVDWIDEYGDGYLSEIDYGDDYYDYIVIFEPDNGDSAGGDWVFEPDSDEPDSSDADIIFTVDDDEISEPEAPDGSTIDPSEESAASAIWAQVAKLIPADLLAKISGFEVFNSDDGTLAYVYPDENNPGKWILGVNAAELENLGELEETLIHEFAHIITLDDGQFNGSSASCSTVQLEEGCASPNSYLAPFYDAFWADIDGEFQQIMQLPEGQQADALANFYQKYQDRFVDEYAATNIAEDMAETFAMFVERDRPTGNSIADQKILFYYNYPELVSLRDTLRANMGK